MLTICTQLFKFKNTNKHTITKYTLTKSGGKKQKNKQINKHIWFGLVWLMLFNATFNNISVISWLSILLAEETGVPGENHRHVANH